jgi:hypothetical protein
MLGIYSIVLNQIKTTCFARLRNLELMGKKAWQKSDIGIEVGRWLRFVHMLMFDHGTYDKTGRPHIRGVDETNKFDSTS